MHIKPQPASRCSSGPNVRTPSLPCVRLAPPALTLHVQRTNLLVRQLGAVEGHQLNLVKGSEPFHGVRLLAQCPAQCLTPPGAWLRACRVRTAPWLWGVPPHAAHHPLHTPRERGWEENAAHNPSSQDGEHPSSSAEGQGVNTNCCPQAALLLLEKPARKTWIPPEEVQPKASTLPSASPLEARAGKVSSSHHSPAASIW